MQIVTGAGRGIGRESASTLASEGVTTVVTDVRQDLLDDVAKDFATRGWAGQQYVCDVRDAARIAEVVDAVVRALGRIDILVNDAGVAPGAPVEQLSEETWDLNMDVNLKGTFLMCRAVAPRHEAALVPGASSTPRPSPRSCRSSAVPRMRRRKLACTTSPACSRGSSGRGA